MDKIFNSVNDTKLINLEKIENNKGNLTVVHNNIEVPFNVERVYYLYDVPGGETRGGHAHRELEQLIVSLSGSFDVLLDDGKERRTIRMNRSYIGLYIPQYIWREIVNFSTGGICLVLASLPYNPEEYVRDYNEFKKIKTNINQVA